MKKAVKILFSLAIVLGVVSCGGNETAENKDVEKNSTVEDNKVDEVTSELDQVTEVIKSTGGGEPIHYKDLQKFLPREIEGYDMEDPEGATLNMQGFSVSSADAEYTSEGGDYIRVSILDYNAASSLYEMSTAMWDLGITVDSDDEYSKSFRLNNDIGGWETFDKINKKANVVAGVGNRLLISVEANSQEDTEKAKDVLASMNLKSLSLVTSKK